ncbi:hypothetical protein FB45DRAFT_1023811 [Roridomyces roridus]|uniref:C2H2-type domain-containing protein n=1 Tax=Roridomyces roridus TaxID=1738132 RepID=A0AAD7C5B5_9AGAR|nr:hypothetical protein FB45DRAFT_1023811 [Roridomyces roridus]
MGLPDTVIISAETVVDLAKLTLFPIRCDAPTPVSQGQGEKRGSQSCGQQLCCWKAFGMHSVKKHSAKRKTSSGGTFYRCLLSKCSGSKFKSAADLKMHVESSHMKLVALPCPFANCAAEYQRFLKERDLVRHLERDHSALLGCQVDLRDRGKLLPGWEPRPPIRPLPAPPDLPLISPLAMRLEMSPKPRVHSYEWLARAEAEPSTSSQLLPPSTPLPSSQTPRPSQLKRLVRTPIRPSSPHSSSSSSSHSDPEYDFDDLPDVTFNEEEGRMSPMGILSPPNFILQRIPGPPLDLVRPQKPTEAPEHPTEPPTSLFYPVLKDQVFAMYASGEDAATDSLAP